MAPRVGIDFGGVTVPIGKRVPGEDTSLDSGTKEPREGAYEAIRELVEISDGNAWIVSKA